jgi:hypothetical protein
MHGTAATLASMLHSISQFVIDPCYLSVPWKAMILSSGRHELIAICLASSFNDPSSNAPISRAAFDYMCNANKAEVKPFRHNAFNEVKQLEHVGRWPTWCVYVANVCMCIDLRRTTFLTRLNERKMNCSRPPFVPSNALYLQKRMVERSNV